MERRWEIRKSLAARVKIAWTDHTGARVEMLAMVEDLSPAGASIRVKKLVGAGSRLEVHWPGRDFSGTVRYCRASAPGYILGVEKDTAPIAPQISE